MSVAALHRNGPVGVDILRIAPGFDWQAVASDYLGPQAVRRITSQPEPEQSLAFAREWTRLEAGLKCLELALQEWNPTLAQRLESCRLIALDLPSGLCGAVAWRWVTRAPVAPPIYVGNIHIHIGKPYAPSASQGLTGHRFEVHGKP